MKFRNCIYLTLAAVLLALQSVSANAQDSTALQELYQKIETMGREIDQLRGENEKLNYQLEQLKLNQKQGFIAIDERLSKLNAVPQAAKPVQPGAPAAKAAPATPAIKPATASQPQGGANQAKPVAAAKPAAATPPATPASVSEKSAYNNAYQTLKGNRKAGIDAFKKFLKDYPNSSLAENAHYWIGEAKYSQRDYQGAIDSFVVVLNQYKSGRKAPDAAVKLGYSFYELKDWTLARRTFNDVLRYFPNSNAAKLAKARLERMQKEGH